MTIRHGPDLILHGGAVIPMAGPPSAAAPGVPADAIAIGDGRVVAVGPGRDILALAGPATRLVDLGGAAVLPGFQDQHAHPLVEGLQAAWLDLTAAPDVAGAMRLLSAAAADARSSFEPDRWVEAWYHPSAWRERRHPSRTELDRAVPDLPVLLHHGSGHAAMANSLGLALAGVTAGHADPPGATIERDESGEPTGLVLGSDPVAPFAAALPPLTPDDLRTAVRVIGTRLSAAGVTAVADAHVGWLGDPLSEVAAYAGAILDEEFAQRLTLMPGLAHLSAPDENPPTPDDIGALVPPDVRGRIRIGPAKFFSDGALSTGDAWLREPYADAARRPPELLRGRPAHAAGELEQRLLRAHLAGWQLATHAIGDAAVAFVLDAYRAILSAHPRADHRHRVEHAMILGPDLLAAAVDLRVVAMLQPEFVTGTGDVYLERLGTRTGDLYAYRRWLDAGLSVAFSSDRPFAPGAPLDGIRAAFRLAGPSGRRLHDDPGPSVPDALRAWTSSAAWAARDEAHTGRLEPGMAADIVVLSADPTRVSPEAWAAGADEVEVRATLVDGRPVFGSPG